MYFYNVNSRRDFEGRNVVIIGTGFPPISTLRLYAASLGVDAKIQDYNEAERIEVRMNGYKFKFLVPTTDPLMQRIYLNFVHHTLLQAAYRARYFSNDAAVVVFSSFPLADFRIREESPGPEALADLAEELSKEIVEESTLKPVQSTKSASGSLPPGNSEFVNSPALICDQTTLTRT